MLARAALDIWIEESRDEVDIATFKESVLEALYHRYGGEAVDMEVYIIKEPLYYQGNYQGCFDHPLKCVRIDKEILVMRAIRSAVRELWFNKDAEGLVRFLLSLPADVRKKVVEDRYFSPYLDLVPEEILDILKKSRVEVRVVLDVKEVVALVVKYGSRWRDVVKDIVREAVSRASHW